MMKRISVLLPVLAMLAIGQPSMAQLQEGQTYRIVPVSATGKSLFVKDASRANNAEVQIWAETDVPVQQWTLGTVGANYTLRNVYTGAYLALTGNSRGSTTRQTTSMTSGRWRLEAVDEAGGIYRMKPTTGNNLLTAGTLADGSLPSLATDADDNTQLWKFVPVEPKTAFNADLREEAMDRFIDVFVTRHDSYRSFGSGGWGNAEMLEVGLDAYEATGLQKYLDLCRSDYNWFNQNVGSSWDHLVYNSTYNWFGHDFNDDVMWQIIAVARMAWITGESQYLNAAKKNFDIIYRRAYMPEWGMMRWAEQSGSATGTNSCIMGPTEVAACYLGMAGAGEEYFEKARDLYAKQRERLANMQTGQVYDSFTIDPETGGVARDEEGKERRNNWASTYNQGTMLGAAVLLYNHYGNEQYRRDADLVVDYTIRHLCNSEGLISVCQVNDGDLCGFKGILMRYVRRYVLDLCRPARVDWLLKNALLAYNNRNERGVTTSAWLTKSTLENATNSFSCSTAASAAVNCVLTPVQKDAYAPLPITELDYQGGTFLVDNDGEPVISLKEGTWAVYDNVDFGTTPAQSLAVRLGRVPYTGTATVQVCLDRKDSEPVATLTATKENDNGVVLAATQPITGAHHVYLRFGYSTKSRPNAYQMASLQFSTQTAEELSAGIGETMRDGENGTKRKGESETMVKVPFDLSGRRTTPHPHGLYITDGRKYSK